MNRYPYIHTIRYMGNKVKLLETIIPEIEQITEPGDLICDIMAGTNTIGYALKARNRIIANDIQFYSYIISKCMLHSFRIPSVEEAHNDLDCYILKNKSDKIYSFFVDNYIDTYFSEHQCLDIDSIRYAIENVLDNNLKNFYLVLLMSAMCKVQSTTGHFAQYMDKNHKRIIPLRRMSIYELFYLKIQDFSSFVLSNYENLCYNLEYKELFKLPIINKVKCFYLDSPYTHDQYSRFYHILETICKYDNPTLEYKAKYRNDRIQSNFCYKNKAAVEFETIIRFCSANKAKLVISYSNHGVIPVEELLEISKKYYKSQKIKIIDYEHSSQGKGKIDIKEVLLVLE